MLNSVLATILATSYLDGAAIPFIALAVLAALATAFAFRFLISNRSLDHLSKRISALERVEGKVLTGIVDLTHAERASEPEEPRVIDITGRWPASDTEPEGVGPVEESLAPAVKPEQGTAETYTVHTLSRPALSAFVIVGVFAAAGCIAQLAAGTAVPQFMIAALVIAGVALPALSYAWLSATPPTGAGVPAGPDHPVAAPTKRATAVVGREQSTSEDVVISRVDR